VQNKEWIPVAGWKYMFVRMPSGVYYLRQPANDYKAQSLGTKDSREAQSLYVENLGNPRVAKGDVDHKTAWENFLEEARKGKPTTAAKHETTYKNHIKKLVHGPIANFNRDFVNAVLDAAEQRKIGQENKQRNLSDSMLLAIKSTMGSFGDYCIDLELLTEANPAHNIRARSWMPSKVKSKKSKNIVEHRAIDPMEVIGYAELEAIVNACGDYIKPVVFRRRTIIQLMALTGMRISECLALTTRDVLIDDAERFGDWGSLLVEKQIRFRFKAKDQSTWFDPILKSDGAARLVSLFEDSHVLLTTYMERGFAEGWLQPGGLLFTSDSGQGPLFASNVGTKISEAAKRAGIERRIKSHMLRHTYASRLFANGADYKLVAEQLGNSPKVTKDVYVHFIKAGEKQNRIASLMAKR
jgi:site-specific recombinase XerD